MILLVWLDKESVKNQAEKKLNMRRRVLRKDMNTCENFLIMKFNRCKYPFLADTLESYCFSMQHNRSLPQKIPVFSQLFSSASLLPEVAEHVTISIKWNFVQG